MGGGECTPLPGGICTTVGPIGVVYEHILVHVVVQSITGAACSTHDQDVATRYQSMYRTHVRVQELSTARWCS